MSQIPPGPSNPPPSPYGGEFGLEPERKSWPKVVGIFSIVWGSLALLCNGCGLAAQMFQSAMIGMMPQASGPNAQQIPPMPDIMKPGLPEYASAALGMLVGVILITGGSMLVARNPLGRVLHLVYAGLSVLLTVVGTALAFQKQTAIAAWAKQNTENFWAKQQMQAGSFAFIGIGIAVLIGLAYPLFCLIWFLAVKRDTREITEGPEEPVA